MPFRSGKYLPNFESGEKVFLAIRQHWIMPAVKILFWLVFMAIFLIARFLLKSYLPSLSSGDAQTILDMVTSMFMLLGLLGLLIVWTMYYLNVQLITNRRIIDINQKSITHHETTALELSNVQDVTTEIKGVVANFLNYGNVYVQTAGIEQNFIFDHIARPHETARTVLSLAGKNPSVPKGDSTRPSPPSP